MTSIGILLNLISHTFLPILSSKKYLIQIFLLKMVSSSVHSLLFNYFEIVEMFIRLHYKLNSNQSWRLSILCDVQSFEKNLLKNKRILG